MSTKIIDSTKLNIRIQQANSRSLPSWTNNSAIQGLRPLRYITYWKKTIKYLYRFWMVFVVSYSFQARDWSGQTASIEDNKN